MAHEHLASMEVKSKPADDRLAGLEAKLLALCASTNRSCTRVDGPTSTVEATPICPHPALRDRPAAKLSCYVDLDANKLLAVVLAHNREP